MKEVYIWGAGHFGALAALDMEQKGKTIAGFIDSDKKLQGNRRLGYKVFAPEQIVSGGEGKIVIAAWFTVNEMVEKLKNNGYVYGEDFEIFEDVKANYNKQICKQVRKQTCSFDINSITKTDKDGELVINDLELVKNINILFENEIILYGKSLGTLEIRLYHRLKSFGVSISYLFENENNEDIKHVYGIDMISLADLKKLDKEKPIVIIIPNSDVIVIDKIINELANLKLRTRKIYTIQALNICLGMKSTENAIKSSNWLLIYQMGKVGSTTLRASMDNIGIKSYHVHSFRYLSSYIPNANQIKIITLVREPVSRTLSAIFQNPADFPNYDMSFDSIISRHLMEGRLLFDWFDHELKEYFGIDIYAHPFDKEKGYSIIKQGNVEVLAMKLEKLNSLEQVISEFIGAPQFKLINANIGNDKHYKYLYKNVKDAIIIPREIFDMYYKDNPKMDHFYSEDEKTDFLKYWEKNITD